MSVRMRHTRAHSGNRRSHHHVEVGQTTACPNCATPHLMHHACGNCGQYRGRVVLDVAKKIEKKAAKQKARAQELGTAEKASIEEEKPLTAAELSKK